MLPCKIRPFVIFDNRNKLFSIARFARYWRLSFKPKTGTETHEPSLCLLYSMCFSFSCSLTHLIDQRANMTYRRPIENGLWIRPFVRQDGSYGFWSCSSSKLTLIHLLIMNEMTILNTTLPLPLVDLFT